MNYLAHLFLSPNHPEQMVGNLMGDFVKGQQLSAYSEAIQFGIHLHRAIDKFTDNHEVVGALKQELSPTRKRFSGIISDVVFDHFLAKHWEQYNDVTLSDFAQQSYEVLKHYHPVMPEKMQLMTTRMRTQNWLEAYQDIDAIGGALNGISRRIRFENKLLDAHLEVLPAYEKYQQAFFEFFPQLQAFVREKITSN